MIELTTAEMIQVSTDWVAPGTTRDAVLAQPALAGMLPSVETAHQGLRRVAPDTELPVRLKTLSDEGFERDLSHDDTIRGTHTVVTGLSILATDPAEKAQLLALLDFMLPEGLQAVRKTYRGEAGEAALLTERMAEQPEKAAQLSALVLPIGGGTPLRTFVDRWIADATRLGAIDSERATLSSATDGPIVTPAEARSARLVWMKQVRAMLAVADAVNLSEAAHQSIFGNLEAAVATASKRGRTPKTVVTTAVVTSDPLKAV